MGRTENPNQPWNVGIIDLRQQFQYVLLTGGIHHWPLEPQPGLLKETHKETGRTQTSRLPRRGSGMGNQVASGLPTPLWIMFWVILKYYTQSSDGGVIPWRNSHPRQSIWSSYFETWGRMKGKSWALLYKCRDKTKQTNKEQNKTTTTTPPKNQSKTEHCLPGASPFLFT